MQNAHAIPITSVPNPNTPEPTVPATHTPGRRFGRTALMIHLLAWLCFGAAWGLMLVLGKESPEGQAVQGVGGAAALTCAIWSSLLALRGIWHGEPVSIPILVLLVFGMEAVVPCVWLWLPLLEAYNPLTPLYEFSLWLGLPLFVPFFVIGSFLVVPLSWAAARLFERWKRKTDEEAWSRRKRLKHGLVVYLAMFALLLVTVFPYPLFGYAALEQSHRKYWRPPVNWQATTLDVMPDYVRTGLDEFCSKYLPWRFVRHRVSLIENGRLPRERLLVLMREDPWEEIRAAAWRTYFREHPAEAIGLCEEMETAKAGERFEQMYTWNLWQARRSFAAWPIQQRIRWMELLLRGMEDSDFRVRRAAACIAQSCIPKTGTTVVPWPWTEVPPPEKSNERASIDAVRKAATGWIVEQQARFRSKQP